MCYSIEYMVLRTIISCSRKVRRGPFGVSISFCQGGGARARMSEGRYRGGGRMKRKAWSGDCALNPMVSSYDSLSVADT